MAGGSAAVDYCVVTENEPEQLEKKVRVLLKDGWAPHGSLSVVAPVIGGEEVAPMYCQAMVKSG